ncbi:MAG: hypothetical protein M1552_09185, partial [Firmicutes bacterium]|nr:hypothetical protein [Bacillota bacterium]MCL5994304.1 hypothetical protein [Bacillota bacterium]
VRLLIGLEVPSKYDLVASRKKNIRQEAVFILPLVPQAAWVSTFLLWSTPSLAMKLKRISLAPTGCQMKFLEVCFGLQHYWRFFVYYLLLFSHTGRWNWQEGLLQEFFKLPEQTMKWRGCLV